MQVACAHHALPRRPVWSFDKLRLKSGKLESRVNGLRPLRLCAARTKACASHTGSPCPIATLQQHALCTPQSIAFFRRRLDNCSSALASCFALPPISIQSCVILPSNIHVGRMPIDQHNLTNHRRALSRE
jgi:hypothetical protein